MCFGQCVPLKNTLVESSFRRIIFSANVSGTKPIGKRRIYRNYYSPKNENVVQYNTFLEKFGQCEDVFDKNKERIERKDYRNILTERVM